MGVSNLVSGRFYVFGNSRSRRNAWFHQVNARNGNYGESSGPRLLPFTDSENGNAETEEDAGLPVDDVRAGESPLLDPDARDLSSLEGRDLTGGSPWRDNV